RLEHVDEILRSARLSGYLFIRFRWAALPGEPPVLEHNDIDDWLPRFIVLHGPCLFFYLLSTGTTFTNYFLLHPYLSRCLMIAESSLVKNYPQDSTFLSDVVEVGSLPNSIREHDEIRYALYVLTRQGLWYECSSASKVQVRN
ncbi:hypothetical protein LINGRAHAP2_LOCUS19544, partial [Linum grandiflorum]